VKKPEAEKLKQEVSIPVPQKKKIEAPKILLNDPERMCTRIEMPKVTPDVEAIFPSLCPNTQVIIAPL
jgi:hypothetical protein